MFGNKKRRIPVSKDDIKKAIKAANDKLKSQNKKLESDIKDAKVSLKDSLSDKKKILSEIEKAESKIYSIEQEIAHNIVSLDKSRRDLQVVQENVLKKEDEEKCIEDNITILLDKEAKVIKSVANLEKRLDQRNGLTKSINALKKEYDSTKKKLEILQDELEIATSESVGVRTAKDALESEFNDYKKSVDEERESLQSDIELMAALKSEKQKEYDAFSSTIDNQLDEMKDELEMHKNLSQKAEQDYVTIQSNVIIAEKKIEEMEDKKASILNRQEEGIKHIKERYEAWKINELDKVAKLKIKGKIDNIDKAGLKEILGE